MSRLWFRIEDVLPLAEHALASPTHRLTAGQIAAGELNGPALSLTRTGERAQIRSNGVPVWYTHDGDEQIAFSASWRRTPAASPDRERVQHLYMPLGSSTAAERRLIDVLRGARHLERNWLAIDTPVWPGAALNTIHLQSFDYRIDIAPPDARWRPVMVTSRQVRNHSYPALVADGCSTDARGLICRFDPTTARQMAEDLTGRWRMGSMPGEYPLLRFDGDIAALLEERDTGTGEIVLDLDERCHPDRDGYYSIGAHRWFWTADTWTPTPRRARMRLHLAALTGRLRNRAATHLPTRQEPAAFDEPPF
ncbi:hypothetical protein [Micromonospora sp. NPDC005324]|uniref:hypothetical protein n=1 Tax=Micromonospora sp. NPDC005324 TaxID=3157033 RepID=UPI0033A7C42E